MLPSPLNTVGFIFNLSFLKNAILISPCFKVLCYNDKGKQYKTYVSAIVKATVWALKSPALSHQSISSSFPKKAIEHADTGISSTSVQA